MRIPQSLVSCRPRHEEGELGTFASQPRDTPQPSGFLVLSSGERQCMPLHRAWHPTRLGGLGERWIACRPKLRYSQIVYLGGGDALHNVIMTHPLFRCIYYMRHGRPTIPARDVCGIRKDCSLRRDTIDEAPIVLRR